LVLLFFFFFARIGKKTKTLGRTGGYEKAIPDITAALERGEIKGLPLFLMGHSYVRTTNYLSIERRLTTDMLLLRRSPVFILNNRVVGWFSTTIALDHCAQNSPD